MQRSSGASRSPEWFRADAERNRRAVAERLRLDGRREPGANLEEGAALAKLALELAGAFEARRG